MEIWKNIPNWNNYKISNFWNVKSLKFWKEKLLKPWLSNWYKVINLRQDNIQKSMKIHRLVMFAFDWINNSDINHINWIKTDNRVENLERCTPGENQKHCYRMWLRKPYVINKWKFWKEHPKSKKVNQYTKQWEFIKTWDSMMDIERELNISNTSISYVCKGKGKTAWWFKWSLCNNNLIGNK